MHSSGQYSNVCVSMRIDKQTVFFSYSKAQGIIGGHGLLFDGRFKFHASIIADGQNVCGGGILDDHHILSAAWCFFNRDGTFRHADYRVMAGRHTGGITGYPIINIEPSQIYVPTVYRSNDPFTQGNIAVIKVRLIICGLRAADTFVEVPSKYPFDFICAQFWLSAKVTGTEQSIRNSQIPILVIFALRKRN